MFTFLRDTGELIKFKQYSFFYKPTCLRKLWTELSLLFFSKHNGGGLIGSVMVRRVVGRGKRYVVDVCISIQSLLNHFEFLII